MAGNTQATAVLELPPGLLEAAHMTPGALKLELALALFQQRKLGFGKARELAGMTAADFQLELGRRKIPVHYDVTDFADDVATLKASGLL